jgi:hypothetical protein
MHREDPRAAQPDLHTWRRLFLSLRPPLLLVISRLCLCCRSSQCLLVFLFLLF